MRIGIGPELAVQLTGTDQAPGALANGSAIVKIGSEPGDAHQDGAPGRVLASMGVGEFLTYCVEWADLPGTPVWIAAHRVKLVE